MELTRQARLLPLFFLLSATHHMALYAMGADSMLPTTKPHLLHCCRSTSSVHLSRLRLQGLPNLRRAPTVVASK